MPKFGISAILSALLMFVSGAVLGAFSYRLYSTSPVQSGRDFGSPGKRMTPEEFRKRYVSDLTAAVKLDPQQIAALNVVLDQIRDEATKLNEKMKKEYDAVSEKWRPDREAMHTLQVERINGLLRPEQRPLYEAFRAERERQRKLHEQQHKKE